ncbi:adenosylcobalamin-dependent ribonucleoside-diphosphate reductase [Natronospora cellulosivora (SeqCode)]
MKNSKRNVIKRDGKKAEYRKEKIFKAIKAAADKANPVSDEKLSKLTDEVDKIVWDKYQKPHVEQIQDIVEKILMSFDHIVAKEYIIYRQKHKENREHWLKEELPLSIWTRKYQCNGEDFEEFFERVSNGNQAIKKMIKNKQFIPAGRILANRGLQEKGIKITYSNCYVLKSPEDNIESIFDTARDAARTFSYGGGVGIDVSNLRPKGSTVNNAAKTTSGAVSFMPLYSMAADVIGQKGRRGALMLSIEIGHPDIEEFIYVKNDLEAVTKANISIKISDEFMEAVENKEMFKTSFMVEDTGEKIEIELDASRLFNKIALSNWNMAEPGFLFWDHIQNWNLLSEDKDFEYAGVNPCAEEPLPAGGSCLLSSINLASLVKDKFTDKAEIDYGLLEDIVKEGVIYLNQVLDEGLSLHPLKIQQETVKNYRQIGLGVMGIADMFIKLGIRYGSKESLEIANKIGDIMINKALQTSAMLAYRYGKYPAYNKKAVLSSKFFMSNANSETRDMVAEYGLRNSQLLTIAPTGTISTMLNISGGIEPLFELSYTRRTQTLHDEEKEYEVYPAIVQEYMTLNNIKDKKDLPGFFVSARKLDYKERINMQSAFQKYIDASISSTINLPNSASLNDIKDLYLYAWNNKLKGVTIFRDGCKRAGILSGESTGNKKELSKEDLIEQGICPECKAELLNSGGCNECRSCGFSVCSR